MEDIYKGWKEKALTVMKEEGITSVWDLISYMNSVGEESFDYEVIRSIASYFGFEESKSDDVYVYFVNEHTKKKIYQDESGEFDLDVDEDESDDEDEDESDEDDSYSIHSHTITSNDVMAVIQKEHISDIESFVNYLNKQFKLPPYPMADAIAGYIDLIVGDGIGTREHGITYYTDRNTAKIIVQNPDTYEFEVK